MRRSAAGALALLATALVGSGAPGRDEAQAPERVRVAICQLYAVDLDLPGNLAKIEACVAKAAAAGAKLAVLPEMVDVGYDEVAVQGPRGAELARPIPGETSRALGAIASSHGVWIGAAILEKTVGGVFDTNVLVDDRGRVVLKQRKAFVYPTFGGAPAFQGNRLDLRTVDSPWGPIGMMNCAETRRPGWRRVLADQEPALVLVTFATGGGFLKDANALAAEAGAPVVGVNMVWPHHRPGQRGGGSRFISNAGTTQWRAGTDEVLEVRDVSLSRRANRPPRADAGDVQTLRWPENRARLRGSASDDGRTSARLSTTWSLERGPGSTTFADAHALETTAVFSAPGIYLLRLTADDGELSRSHRVSINVLPAGNGDPAWVGHWPFDGSAAERRSGNHGVLGGDPGYAADPAPTPGFANTHSLDLDGDGDYVRVGHDVSLDAPAAVTLALWVKARSYPGFFPQGNDWAGLISKGERWGLENYILGFGAYFYVYAKGTDGLLVPSLDDAVRTPNTWHHVAAVLDPDGNQGKIYIDGVLDHRIVAVPEMRPNTDPLYIGLSRPGRTSIDGRIDDVRLYTRALSDAEIAALVGGARINQPPTVDAGPNATVRIPDAAVLEGSYRDDGHPATSAIARWTAWRKLRGPGRADFADVHAPATRVTFSRPGTYVLELRGSDGAHLVRDTATVVAAAPES